MTGKKDCCKSATFVNLIHQRDGYIAMKFVESLDMDTPIYTVHENCISTARHCEKFPDFYLDVFIKMRSPLLIINQLKKTRGSLHPRGRISFFTLGVFFQLVLFPTVFLHAWED